VFGDAQEIPNESSSSPFHITKLDTLMDISRCTNETCPLKCWRRIFPPSDWQAYTRFEPDGDNCEWFIPIPHEKINKINELQRDVR